MKRFSTFFISFFLFVALTSNVFATTYYSQGNLPPNLFSSWNSFAGGGGVAPTAFTTGDMFQVQFGDTMITTGVWTVSGLNSAIVVNGGSLTLAHTTTTEQLRILSGDLSISTGITVTVNNGNTAGLGEDLYVNDILNNAGTITYGSGASGSVTNSGKYFHLSNGGTIPLFTWTTFSTCSINGVTTILPAGLNQGFGNIVYNSTGQTSNVTWSTAPSTISNLTIKSTGTASLILGTNISPSTNLTINGGIFDLSTYQADSISATAITIDSGATLKIGGTNSFPTNYSTHALNAGSTVEYYGAGAQTIAAEKYGNLTISGFRGVGPVTFSNLDTIGIAGTFSLIATFSGSGVVATGSTIEFTGGNVQSLPVIPFAVPYNNIVVNKTAAGLNAGGALVLNGDLALVQGGFYDNGNIITVKGNIFGNNGFHSTISGGRILVTGGASHQIGGVTFGRIEIDDVSFGASTIGSPTINDLILTNGIFTLNHILNISSPGTISAASGNLSATKQVIFNGIGSVIGAVSFDSVMINGAVNFDTTSTISGVLKINLGGMITTNPPIFANGSTLIYSTGGIFNRGPEWRATSGAGYPFNVQISNSTMLNLGYGGAANIAREIAGSLTVDLGSTLSMSETLYVMTAPLTVNGSIVNNGTIILPSLSGGNLRLLGDYTHNGILINNSSSVNFIGTSKQKIERIGGGYVPFDSLIIASSDTVELISSPFTNLQINNRLEIQSGMLKVNGGVIDFSTGALLSNTGGTIVPGNHVVSFNGSATVTGAFQFWNVNVFGSVDLGSTTSIDNELKIQSGGLLITHSPTYNPGSTLIYFANSVFNRGLEWDALSGPGFPYNVRIENTTTLNLGYGGSNVERKIGGNLFVETGSMLTMNEISNEMTAPLTVLGNVTVNGSLVLSSFSGGDFKLGGNLSVAIGSDLIHNNRTVWFIGSSNQSISEASVSLLKLGGMKIENGVNSVMLNCGLEIADTLWMFGGNINTDTTYIKIDTSGIVERLSGAVVGNLKKEFPAGNNISKRFEVGSGAAYTPVDVTFANIFSPSFLSVRADSTGPNLLGSGIDSTKKVRAYWSIVNNGISFDTYNATLNFTPAIVDSGSDFNKFIVSTFNGVWNIKGAGSKTDSSTQIVSANQFGTFAVGEYQTFTITSMAIGNGTISPNGITGVNAGDTLMVTFLPDTLHHIDSLFIDGIANYDSVNFFHYTFVNIAGNHTIDVFYSINTHPINVFVTGTGTITPSFSNVNHGDSVVFTIQANVGSHIDSIRIDDPIHLPSFVMPKSNFDELPFADKSDSRSRSAKAMFDSLFVIYGTGNDDTVETYTFHNVTAYHFIEGFFSVNKYTISASIFGNGLITPVGDSTLIFGDSIAYAIVPDSNHHIDSVVVDSVNIGVQPFYVFNNISASHNITAYVSPNLNNVPVFTLVLSDTAIARFDTLSFQYHAFDPDSGVISYGLANPPSGASIDSTGLVTYIPAVNANGMNSIIVQVTDDSGAVVNDTAKVRVNIYGDVSGNGAISSFDASLILRDVVGLDSLNSLQIRIADVSGIAGISSLDASYILQYSVGIISTFPGGFGKQQQADAVLSAFSFRIEKSKATDEYDLYISVNKASHVSGVAMDLGYDSTIVTPKLFTKTAASDSMFMVSHFFGEHVKLAMAGFKPLNNTGDAVKFTFALKDKNYPKNAVLFTINKFLLNETDFTNGIGNITLNIRDLGQLPTVYKLEQNFPNPFNPTTTINYQLPEASGVKITVYNILGQEIKSLVSEQQEAGYYSQQWNGTDNANRLVATGMYIYRIEAVGGGNKHFTQVKKMMMIK